MVSSLFAALVGHALFTLEWKLEEVFTISTNDDAFHWTKVKAEP